MRKYLLVFLIFILGLFFLSQIGLSFHPSLNLHLPILIEGNGDFTEENGVISGSGTKDDPYIIAAKIAGSQIQGWKVNNRRSNYAIKVYNATAYFVIKNCSVSGSYIGIDFSNVQNGRMEACTVSNNEIGIYLNHSSGNLGCLSQDSKIIAPVSQKEKKPNTSRKREVERVELIDEEHEFIKAYNNDLVFGIQGPIMGVKGAPEYLIAEVRYELTDTSVEFVISGDIGVRTYMTKDETLSSFNGNFTIGTKKDELVQKEDKEIDETTFKTVSLKAIHPISPLASSKLSLTIQHANLEEDETSQGSLYTWRTIYGEIEIEGEPSRISPRLGGEFGSVQENTILGELKVSSSLFLGVDIGKKLRPIFGLRLESEASDMADESTWSGYLILEKEQFWTSIPGGEFGIKGEFTSEGVIEGLTKSFRT